MLCSRCKKDLAKKSKGRIGFTPETPVDDLPLTQRTISALKLNDVVDLGTLAALPILELWQVNGLGLAAIMEIARFMAGRSAWEFRGIDPYERIRAVSVNRLRDRRPPWERGVVDTPSEDESDENDS